MAESGIQSGPVMQSDPGTSVAAMSPRRAGRPFDSWLHKQLHEMYDSITKEPLPEDLLSLIDKGTVPDVKSDQIEPDRRGTRRTT